MLRSRKDSGFTLVELSIVIVIIGIIIGGTLIGKDMVRASEIRSITEDANQYLSKVTLFKEKYQGLPGDITNATALWGAANADATTCKTTEGTGTQTCNGDGDGKIRAFGTATTDYEAFRSVQQLAIAGMIQGTFTGISGSGGTFDPIPGTNVTLSKINGAGIVVAHFGYITANAEYYDGDYGHQIVFMKRSSGAGTSAFMTPLELTEVDTKMDDGEPSTGRVRSTKGDGSLMPDCATTASPPRYNVSLTNPVCYFSYKAF